MRSKYCFFPELVSFITSQSVSKKLRSGVVYINGNSADSGTPFGGYRQSGNGREGGTWGLHEYLEVKTITEWKN